MNDPFVRLMAQKIADHEIRGYSNTPSLARLEMLLRATGEIDERGQVADSVTRVIDVCPTIHER